MRAAAAILACALLLSGCAGSGLGGVPAPIAAPGDRADAPAFSVPALDGGAPVALDDHRGRPVVLNFWASWCGPCRDEMPALMAFADANPAVSVVGLAVNDRPADSRAFAGRLGVAYPLGIDRDAGVALEYGATGLPVTVLIDEEGRLASTVFGEVTQQELEAMLAGLAA